MRWRKTLIWNYIAIYHVKRLDTGMGKDWKMRKDKDTFVAAHKEREKCNKGDHINNKNANMRKDIRRLI